MIVGLLGLCLYDSSAPILTAKLAPSLDRTAPCRATRLDLHVFEDVQRRTNTSHGTEAPFPGPRGQSAPIGDTGTAVPAPAPDLPRPELDCHVVHHDAAHSVSSLRRGRRSTLKNTPSPATDAEIPKYALKHEVATPGTAAAWARHRRVVHHRAAPPSADELHRNDASDLKMTTPAVASPWSSSNSPPDNGSIPVVYLENRKPAPFAWRNAPTTSELAALSSH